MKDEERELVLRELSTKYKYHDKIYRYELATLLEPGVGGIYSQSVCPAWDTNAEDQARRDAKNCIARMLRAGIIQTTRERGRYRIIAWELREQEAA